MYIKLAIKFVVSSRKRRRPYIWMISVKSWVDWAMSVYLSIYTRTSPTVFETSIWTFARVLFSLRNCLFVETDEDGSLWCVAQISWRIKIKIKTSIKSIFSILSNHSASWMMLISKWLETTSKKLKANRWPLTFQI